MFNVLDIVKARTEKICSLFLAFFMVFNGGFGCFGGVTRANGLGRREILPDGTKRITFNRNEFPALLAAFRAEENRLNTISEQNRAFYTSLAVESIYILPIVLAIESFFFRAIGINAASLSSILFFGDENLPGYAFDVCIGIASSLVYAYSGIPKENRIGGRWNYYHVKAFAEQIEFLTNEQRRDVQDIFEIYIDSNLDGSIRMGIDRRNGNNGYLEIHPFCGPGEGPNCGLAHNRFWEKL